MANISDLPQPARKDKTIEITVYELTLLGEALDVVSTERYTGTANLKIHRAIEAYYTMVKRHENQNGLITESHRRIQKLEKQINYLEDFLASEGYERTDK